MPYKWNGIFLVYEINLLFVACLHVVKAIISVMNSTIIICLPVNEACYFLKCFVTSYDKATRSLPPSVQPHVRVWESINLTTLHVIGEKEFQRGVSCVSFSPVSHTHSVLVISLQVTYQQNLKWGSMPDKMAGNLITSNIATARNQWYS